MHWRRLPQQAGDAVVLSMAYPQSADEFLAGLVQPSMPSWRPTGRSVSTWSWVSVSGSLTPASVVRLAIPSASCMRPSDEIVAAGTPPTWFHPTGGTPADDSRAFPRFEESLATVDFSPNRGGVFSAHQMGSVRMGGDPASHPCDAWGRVRAGAGADTVIGGLYVGDSSVFPTAIGVTPMITIMALARRVSRVVLAET